MRTQHTHIPYPKDNHSFTNGQCSKCSCLLENGIYTRKGTQIEHQSTIPLPCSEITTQNLDTFLWSEYLKIELG